MDDVERMVARAEDDATEPGELATVLDELVVRAPGIAAAVALGLLAREPRVKPSRRLLIDPSDAAYRRWRRRVVAAAALLASAQVRHELAAEFADSPDLERDARAWVTGATGAT
ncbi:hypothetical protein [Jatrophihabitans endophyticus]|uniref:hypothetical protein n=1 Tax=Jatrophihabitans endophyticus TaxID=1206085 RepID=UPI0019E5E4A2|nr:hypothetical protein [Jatrophihabitans endophyticus]MBE7190110.1 hypothetical protein [Jatrophihabitans endophyticus]